MLVQTPKTVYVVEVKRKNHIDSVIEDEVRRKIKWLPIRSGMAVRPVLVYAGEISKSVEADGYFGEVGFRELARDCGNYEGTDCIKNTICALKGLEVWRRF